MLTCGKNNEKKKTQKQIKKTTIQVELSVAIFVKVNSIGTC